MITLIFEHQEIFGLPAPVKWQHILTTLVSVSFVLLGAMIGLKVCTILIYASLARQPPHNYALENKQTG